MRDARFVAFAALSLLAGDGNVAMQIPPASWKGHKGSAGVICGHDQGIDRMKSQPRNSPCQCGSGKKAKKCCRYVNPEKPVESAEKE